MKWLKFLPVILSLVLLLSWLSAPLRWTDFYKPDRAPAAEGGAGHLVDLISHIPFSGKRIQDYLEATGIKSYGAGDTTSNKGLLEYNQKLITQNRCFGELASRMADEIKLIDLARSPETNLSNAGIRLSQKLTSASEPKAGFLWDLALKYADHDQNLAMHLIGICGHDDVNGQNQLVNLPAYSDKRIEAIKQNAWGHKASQLDDWDAQHGRDSNQNVIYDYSFSHYSPEDIQTSLMSQSCPLRNSSMYILGALGSDVDLPSDFKSEIVRAQAPINGAGALPAKAYHIIGGAYATCLLVERGMRGFMAAEMNKVAVEAYRSKTICEKISPEYELGVRQNKVSAITRNDLLIFQGWLKNKPNGCKTLDLKYAKLQIVCDLSKEPQAQSSSGSIDSIFQMSARADAAYLVGQKSGFQRMYKAACDKIDITSSLERSMNALGRSDCSIGWAASRCDKAIAVVDSWKTDFKWTREEQLVGSRFASAQCTNIGMADPLAHSCDALRLVRLARPSILKQPLKSNGSSQ